jgi:hypothetical protein
MWLGGARSALPLNRQSDSRRGCGVGIALSGPRMLIFVKQALIVSLIIFFTASVGFGVEALLSPSYLADSKAMIASVNGLDATLLAIVLGLLIWTSHGLFMGQQGDLQKIVRASVMLDVAFAGYGSDTKAARDELRQILQRIKTRFWIEDPTRRRQLVYGEIVAEVAPMRALLGALHPQTSEQREHLANARDMFNTIMETQVTMIRTLVNPVPHLLLNVVIGWSCVLFFGYGLTCSLNLLSAIMAALGALLVGSAAFLILELSEAYVGLLLMPTAGFNTLFQSLERLGATSGR